MTSEEATDLIIYNQTVKDATISGEISFPTEVFNHEVNFTNCAINSFQGKNVHFNKKVVFDYCKFKKCDFSFAYFLGGLEMYNCYFDKYLDFQCGGHNKPEHLIKFENNEFADFVNFYDCSYDGPFILCGNDFKKGTNIFGNKNMPYVTTFKVSPVVDKSNKGVLDLNGEGK